MKACRRCKIEKPLEEFYPNRTKYFRDGRSYVCKECEKEVSRNRPYNSARQRINAVRHLYGLEPGDYESLVEKQNGLCAICGNPPSRKLHIDHCHDTNKIRGLLCVPCNTGIGMLKDNIDNLKNAIKYLEQSQ